MSFRFPRVAVVGATGAVGAELIACLQARRFPLAQLRLFASARSAGRTLPFRGEQLPVEALDENSLTQSDIALFSAGGTISRQYAPGVAAAGAVVIDNSSVFRMRTDVPLVVPEINRDSLRHHTGIIANPNCVAILSALPLWPLHREFNLCRVIASTYQAASGAGAAAMEELRAATGAALAGSVYPPRVLRHPYAFNLYSHDTTVDPATGANEEERSRAGAAQIMQLPDLRIGVTCIRVPVLRAHAVSLTLEFERRVTPVAVRELLAHAPGVRIVDDMQNNHFPTPIEASGEGDVLVGRIRSDGSDPSGRSLSLFLAGDQLLKGAALNAVQIAELPTQPSHCS